MEEFKTWHCRHEIKLAFHGLKSHEDCFFFQTMGIGQAKLQKTRTPGRDRIGMMASLNYLLLVIGALVCMPSLILFAETAAAFFLPRRGRPVITEGKFRSIAVLVPAHNESGGIAPTLEDISRQLNSGDQLVVVADNCTDDTAAVASVHGAHVIVRNDMERRGKGYALAFGLEYLAARPPEIVIIVDADCRLGADTIRTLAAASAESNRPVQALYLMKPPGGHEQRFAVAEFAWIVRNHVRPLGLANLGLPCQLMGTGMAFPWRIISSANLASGNLVEDLELGLNLARIGHPPKFCIEAIVESLFPTTEEGMVKQRQRWEHGSLSMLLKRSVRLCFAAAWLLNLPLLVLGLDLMVPPLAVHAAIVLLSTAACGVLYLFGTSGLPLALAMLGGILIVASLLLSWAGFGRTALPAKQFQSVLPYLLAKLKIYKGFSARNPIEWLRSDRTKEK